MLLVQLQSEAHKLVMCKLDHLNGITMEQEIERVTEKHTHDGSPIDLGCVSGTSTVQSDTRLWKLAEQ